MTHGGPACHVTVGSATRLGLPDSCVDYIFADPPFGSNLYYSEVNLLWEAWLRSLLKLNKRLVVHREQDGGSKRLPIYASLMGDCFREMNRVLKPGRWVSVVFHNSDETIWQTILDGAEAAGFELVEINAFDKEQLTFKALRGQKGLERVTNKDIVLNLRKPKPGEQATANGKSSPTEAEKRVVEASRTSWMPTPPPKIARCRTSGTTSFCNSCVVAACRSAWPTSARCCHTTSRRWTGAGICAGKP